jgi:hypothetical protein
VPSECPNIQAGVDSAANGDTVLVAPGTYSGEGNHFVSWGEYNLVLTSEAGAENTTIDCGGDDYAMIVGTGKDSTTVISGFTITNGGGLNGGALKVSHASPIIEDCIFFGNNATSNGGGIYYGYPESPGGVVRNCVFYGNSATYRGGGMSLDSCVSPNEPRITNCVFYGNVAGIGGTHGGGAIFANHSLGLITYCTLVGNTGEFGAGGIGLYASSLTIRNTVIAFSTQGEGIEYGDVQHCIIYANAGGDTVSGQPDNLYQDPLFCNIDADNFELCSNSPCLAANNAWSELVGAMGQGCDECDAPTRQSAWGMIKSLF